MSKGAAVAAPGKLYLGSGSWSYGFKVTDSRPGLGRAKNGPEFFFTAGN